MAWAWTIRQATVADIPALVARRLDLLRAVGDIPPRASTDDLAAALERYFAETIPTGRFVAWIAEAEGAVVASSGLAILERPPAFSNLGGLEGYILNMYTLPGWRRRGIGGALLREILAYAKRAGVARLWLHTSDDGRAIYEAAGFSPNRAELELSDW